MADKYVKLNDIIDTIEHEWGYEGLREELEELPTADVVEVKHGKWIYNTDDFTPKMRCSVCGYNKLMVAGECIEQEPNDFCNNCGADMRGDNK